MREWIVLMMGLVAFGCATQRIERWHESSDPQPTNITAQDRRLLIQAKKDWLERHVRISLDRALGRLEEFVSRNPGHTEAHTLLARGHYLLAEFHVEENSSRLAHFEKAVGWGERALASNSRFKNWIALNSKAHEEFGGALQFFSRNEVDPLYWYAASLERWSQLQGGATQLKYQNRVTVLMRRVESLDPNYYYGAIHRFWGRYYAETPFFAGGSLEKSLDSYRKTFKVEERYFGSHLEFAEKYATQRRDRELFRNELLRVVQGQETELPDVRSEQILEKRRAKSMLEKIDYYF